MSQISSCELKCGERFLIPPYGGSNPPAPASQCGLCGVISRCGRSVLRRRLERQEENPTVGVLDRPAKTLAVPVFEFFTEPAKGAAPPGALKSRRRRGVPPRGKPRTRTG